MMMNTENEPLPNHRNYLRLLPVEPFAPLEEDQSLTMQQAQEIWQSANTYNRHALIAYCLGWKQILPWTAEFFHAFALFDQVEIFWHDRFTDTLYALAVARAGMHQVAFLDAKEAAYQLVGLMTSTCKHLEDLCFAFVYAHPKGCSALQAYSAHMHRMEAL